MRAITFHQPRTLVFGDHSFDQFIDFIKESPYNNILILADSTLSRFVDKLVGALHAAGKSTTLSMDIVTEPVIADVNYLREIAKKNSVDSVLGIGGGSVLDVAKILAVVTNTNLIIKDLFGIGKIRERKLFLCCLPSTSGTGSEVSPNAILLDEEENLKKGIISPHLVPDASFIDPVLTYSVPPEVTAGTGIDALTHCIEAYANRNAHPVVDLYALKGIELIVRSLEKAVRDGTEPVARAEVALGSLYGGMCLGPVNTAAVHALSYPLGGTYHLPHGVSNAILLPKILKFNLPEGIDKYAQIAKAIGIPPEKDPEKMASKGIDKISELCRSVGIPEKLTGFNIPGEAIPDMARMAITVERLLKNNLRTVTEEDACNIYAQLL